MLTKNILVTGGEGFIGKPLVFYLKRLGHNVKVWDIKNGINILRKLPSPSRWYDVIIHLAAELEILNSSPIKEMDLNLRATLRLLEWARKYNVKKFVFASSAAVYGEADVRPTPETAPLRPFWSYGSSKLASEVYIQQYEELYGIKSVMIRPAIVTGVGEWYGRFVTLSLARIRQNKPILVFGSGRQTRDFVNVLDTAYAFYLSSIKNVPTPLILNIGSGKEVMIKDVANFLSKLAGGHPIKYVNPKVGELGRKPHELKHLCLDIRRAKKYLGWKPMTSLKETLKLEYKWVMKMSEREFREWTRNPRY